MNIFLRFFVILFAYWIATFAAAAVLVLGAVSPGLSTPPAGSEEWPVIGFLIMMTSVFVGAIAFVPSAIAIVITEAFGWRWLVLYALAGAAIGVFSAHSAGFIEWRPEMGENFLRTGNTELMAAAGIAAGFVYWLIAGRRAGGWRDV